MEINLITHNPNKVKEFKSVLEPLIKVNHIDLEYPELKADDSIEIASLAAIQLSNILKKPIVVEDSGLFITALHDFPGTCSAYVHKRIGLEGILKLMKGIKDRTAFYKSAVSYCEPGKKPVTFLGAEKGTIATTIRGKFGFGHDPLFIPLRSKKTYGQIRNCHEIKKFRKHAILQLLDYLRKKKECGR